MNAVCAGQANNILLGLILTAVGTDVLAVACITAVPVQPFDGLVTVTV